MKYLPTWCCKNIFSIDIEELKKNNIKYIFTDLDNTLAPYNVPLPTKEVKDVISTFKKEGFTVIIVSNNTAKRVEIFSKELDVELIAGAKKPFTHQMNKYLKEHNISRDEIVLIGDQLMTDIKCAIKLGCKCILTTPLSKNEALVTFVNRRIDIYLRKKYDLNKTAKRIDRSDKI